MYQNQIQKQIIGSYTHGQCLYCNEKKMCLYFNKVKDMCLLFNRKKDIRHLYWEQKW